MNWSRAPPIGGLVKEIEGRPIVGADVTLAFADAFERPDGDFLTRSYWSVDGDFPYVTVKTDAEGRSRTTSMPVDLGVRPVVLVRVAHPQYVSDTGNSNDSSASGRLLR